MLAHSKWSRILGVLFLPIVAGCVSEEATDPSVLRDTLPNGAVRVHYSALPAEADLFAYDLEIGTLDGEAYEVFGDIRSIEAGPDGAIYVLDYQAVEVRKFDSDGGYLGVIASEGEGPGEFIQGNGILLDGDGTLWVQDHARWRFIGIAPDGSEVARFPMPALNYGYMFNGALDWAGRFWKPTSHSDQERAYPPETGLSQGSGRSYWKYYDRASDVTDSIFVGTFTRRTYIAATGGGFSYAGVPFDPSLTTIVDLEGGFWSANTAMYRIARLDEAGDTVLVIEADVPQLPVTDEDNRAYVEQAGERGPDQLRAAEAVVELVPENKPALAGLFVDDENRLWVRRTTPRGEGPRYDVFSRDGDFLGAVRPDFLPAPSFPRACAMGGSTRSCSMTWTFSGWSGRRFRPWEADRGEFAGSAPQLRASSRARFYASAIALPTGAG